MGRVGDSLCGRQRWSSTRRSRSPTSTIASSAPSSSTWAAASTAGSTSATAAAIRADVLELVRELGVTIVRYPGGNFVSGYDWEDGIGPREQRPRRLELAWRSIETNLVGTDEFLAWARAAGAQPMLAVNMGTRGLDAARRLVEFCNAPRGTRVGGPRGRDEPYGVRVWCIGNEMDGPWQIGHKDAVAYGKLANETGKAMRLVDPVDRARRLRQLARAHADVRRVGGHRPRPRLGRRRPHLAAHVLRPGAVRDAPRPSWPPRVDLDRMIDTVAATADAVAARKRSRRRVSLSVDEWNVWYQSRAGWSSARTGRSSTAPPLIEDTYTVTDALVVGSHADHAAAPRRPREDGVPGAARERDRADPHARRRPGLAADHVLPVPRRRAPRPRHGAARRARRADLPDRGRRGRARAGGDRRPERGHADAVRRQPRHRAAGRCRRSCAARRACSITPCWPTRTPRRPTPPKQPDRVRRASLTGARIDGERLRATLPPRSWNVLRLRV